MESADIESVTILSRQEGYDYVFVPQLDPKYECAICLLGLRSPLQTSCGHRFCKECIYNSMSESSHRCPIDNKPLTEADLFPDSCAEREILQLSVRCPNYCLGCHYIVDLMYIDHHIQACQFQPVMCPNECSATVLSKELDNHLDSECVLRVKRCGLCSEPFVFNQEQLHLLSCTLVRVVCETCGTMLARGDMAQHLTENCPQVVVACSFAEHGCHQKMTRADLEQHMAQSTQFHLQLVSSVYKKINAYVLDLSRTVGIIQSPYGSFSRQPSLRSQISATSPIPEHHTSPNNPDRTLEKSLGASGGGDKQPVFPQVGEKNGAECSPETACKLQLHIGEGSKAGGKPPTSSALSQQNVILRDLCEKSVDFGQSLLQENIRLRNLEKRVEDVDALLELQRLEVSGRMCNGEFVWRIRNFPQDLEENRKHVWHSPSFYTSQFGYKFCIRLNVAVRDDVEYLSLFIHLKLGENDDFLDWPFYGWFTFSILDVGSSDNPKKHITETIQSKTGRQAFIRPETERNSKGFGYTEFVEVKKVLENEDGMYVKDGMLSIRVMVRPGEMEHRKQDCICHFQRGGSR